MWHTYHFFNFDFSRMNHCLIEAIRPLSDRLKSDMFFIRYWHGGPHLRFRMRSHSDAQLVKCGLHDYWTEFGQPVTLDPKEYYKTYSSQFAAEGLARTDILYSPGDIIAFEYEPEVNRYGGQDALAACERFFCKDSFRLVQALSKDPIHNEKLMLAYCLTLADILDEAGFDSSRLFDLNAQSNSPSSHWLSEQVRKRFTQNSVVYVSLMDKFRAKDLFPAQCKWFRDDVIELLQELKVSNPSVVLPVIHSVLHMSFNRAGVAPFKENTLRYFTHLMIEKSGETHARKAS